MRVYVTGASGFIGSRVARERREQGAEVHDQFVALEHGHSGERYILGGANLPLREIFPAERELGYRPGPVEPALARAVADLSAGAGGASESTGPAR